MSDLKLVWERRPRSGLWAAKAGHLTLFAWDIGPKQFSWWFEATPPEDPSAMPERPEALGSGWKETFEEAKLAAEAAVLAWLSEAARALKFLMLDDKEIQRCVSALRDSAKLHDRRAADTVIKEWYEEYCVEARKDRELADQLEGE